MERLCNSQARSNCLQVFENQKLDLATPQLQGDTEKTSASSVPSISENSKNKTGIKTNKKKPRRTRGLALPVVNTTLRDVTNFLDPGAIEKLQSKMRGTKGTVFLQQSSAVKKLKKETRLLIDPFRVEVKR